MKAWRTRRARALLAAFGLVVFGAIAAGCWRQKVWSGATEFVGRLHCGMSQPEAERIAETYEGLKLEVQEQKKDSLVFWNGGTMIELSFESNGLRRAKVTWIDTIMHVTSLPEVDLCGAMGGGPWDRRRSQGLVPVPVGVAGEATTLAYLA